MPQLTHLETELRARARQLIREGRLPDRAPRRVWGGAGSGLPCALCGEVVPTGELEYEADGTVAGIVRTLHFHFLCHAAWQFECARAEFTGHPRDGKEKRATPPRGLPLPKPSRSERSLLEGSGPPVLVWLSRPM